MSCLAEAKGFAVLFIIISSIALPLAFVSLIISTSTLQTQEFFKVLIYKYDMC